MNKSELKKLIREVVEEVAASKIKKVRGKYIYFVMDGELFKLNPLQLVGAIGPVEFGKTYQNLSKNWHKATVMQGEDVRNILGIPVTDLTAWYEVDESNKQRAYIAYIGS